jgi:hypothetical protein
MLLVRLGEKPAYMLGLALDLLSFAASVGALRALPLLSATPAARRSWPPGDALRERALAELDICVSLADPHGCPRGPLEIVEIERRRCIGEPAPN